MSNYGPGHRAEIDGLRAIAVLAVVFYHFSVPGFGGGFIGVDIFFVISGFLIGGILWRDLTGRGTISLTNFYARRVRRLAPAYFVMAIVTFLVAYIVLLPFEFREFGKSLIASTAYLSNVYFYREAGYFDTGAANKILLHTWSLSVEEQFYILLPPLMLLLRRRRTALIATLCMVSLVSLVLCIVVTRMSHTAAFFLFPFRAWELLAGVLLAIYGQERAEKWQQGPALSWIGLAMLAAAIGLTQPGPSFPGYQVILPVLGALLILYNGQHDNLVNRALSSPGPVFVGLISYSLYLWHWPVLTLSTYYGDGTGSTAEQFGWLALSFVLAWASWRFVERPVRVATALRPSMLFAGVVASSACLLVAGSMVYLRDGMPDRFNPAIRMHIDASADFLQDWSRCSVEGSGPLQGIEVCPIGAEDPPTFLVWGDSHVRAFKEGIELLAKERGRSGLLIWRAGCPPLFGIEKRESAATRQQDQDCTDANKRIRQALPSMGIKRLLVIGRWAYYSEGRGTGNDVINTISLSPSLGAGFSGDQHSLFTGAVLETMSELSSSFDQVIVLRQVPEIPAYDSRNVARLLAHQRLTPKEAEKTLFTVPIPELVARTNESEVAFRQLAEEGKITWLDSWDAFCSGQDCAAVRDGWSLYFDNNHVTNTTALSLREMFDPLMAPDDDAVQNSTARQ